MKTKFGGKNVENRRFFPPFSTKKWEANYVSGYSQKAVQSVINKMLTK